MEKILVEHPWIIVIILLWSLPWKGAALWRAARRGHLGWFLTLLVFNTLAILDIIYIFFFSGPDVKEKPEQDEVRQARMQRFREKQEQKKELEQKIDQQQEVSIRQTAAGMPQRKRQTII